MTNLPSGIQALAHMALGVVIALVARAILTRVVAFGVNYLRARPHMRSRLEHNRVAELLPEVIGGFCILDNYPAVHGRGN
ncbi:MAG: hypothetical protein O3A51_05335 [Verrucomicrobia bacterium]|nr:hypothetical protein [Verrucomicrobiota bacterium]